MIINASSTDITGNRLTLLWENDNPSSDYDNDAPIAIDREGYEFLLIEFLPVSSMNYLNLSILLNDIGKYKLNTCAGSLNGYRYVTISDTAIAFSSRASYFRILSNGGNTMVDFGSRNNFLIPYKIYGYKA